MSCNTLFPILRLAGEARRRGEAERAPVLSSCGIHGRIGGQELSCWTSRIAGTQGQSVALSFLRMPKLDGCSAIEYLLELLGKHMLPTFSSPSLQAISHNSGTASRCGSGQAAGCEHRRVDAGDRVPGVVVPVERQSRRRRSGAGPLDEDPRPAQSVCEASCCFRNAVLHIDN